MTNNNMIKNLRKILAASSVFLSACSSKIVVPDYNFNPNANSNKATIDQYSLLLRQIENNLDNIWGTDEVVLASKSNFVRYDDNYHTRALINFFDGSVKFETVDNKNARKSLENIIIHLSLMGENEDINSLYMSSDPKISKDPFFRGQLKSSNGKDILTVKEAKQFAQTLLNKIHTRRSTDQRHQISYVETKLTNNHLNERARKYQKLVNLYSTKYGVDSRLVYSIIEIESAFNPFAVSNSGAIGLMQIVPSTAGLHIFQLRGRSDKPSKNYLFNPNNNISIGTQYLQLLKNVYFKDIKNPTNLTYMMITSYNAGPGGTLRVFHKDQKKAIDMINRMSSKELYAYLQRNHHSNQAKRYLEKVSTALDKYY